MSLFDFSASTEIQLGKVLSDRILRGVLEERAQMVQTRRAQNDDTVSDFASIEDGNDLLHYNIRPSQSQNVALNEILRQKNLELEDMETNALCLQEEINTLLRRFQKTIQSRKRKTDDVNFYKYMLSPIRLLPPEVLIIIFQYAVETCAPVSQAWSPLGLSHVCRAWRNAIVGCSKFWTELELNPYNFSRGPRYPPSLDLFSTLIPTWLGRGKRFRRLALNIFFEDQARAIHPHDFLLGVGSVASRLTELLLLFRWKEHGTVVSPLLTLNSCVFPALEKLTLIEDYNPNEEVVRNPLPISVFRSSPSLRILTLAVCPLRLFGATHLLPLPWAQLTCLELVRPISLQSLAIVVFYYCPQIHTLVIPELDAQDADPVDFFLPSDRVPLPNLTTLKLNLRGNENPINEAGALDVFAKLHLPRVQTIELSAGPHMNHVLFPLFIALQCIHDSSSCIRRLLLAHIGTNTLELSSVFVACPNLEELVLYLPYFPPQEVLDCLRMPSDATQYSKPLHSRLISFTFAFQMQDVNDTDVFVRAFLDLCKSWARDPLREQPLETLTLIGCNFNTSTAERRIVPQIYRDIRRRLDSLCLFHGSFTTQHVQYPILLPRFLGLDRPFYEGAFCR